MTSSHDLATIRSAYLAEFENYEQLANVIKRQVRKACRKSRIVATISGRAKDPVSFLKKAWREPGKYTDPMTQITDKAGVRIVVPTLVDVAAVEQLVTSMFKVLEREDKLDRLDPDQLGYLGIHFLVRCKKKTLRVAEQHLAGLVSEIQIHTQAQNAWASVSHPLTYKPIPGVEHSPVIRRVMRAVALVSLFDDEVNAARDELVDQPGYEQAALLNELDRHFPLFSSTTDYDVALSMRLLSVIRNAYDGAELSHYADLIDTYVAQRSDRLARLYRMDGIPEHLGLLVSQPEFIAICERLDAAPLKLKAIWCQTFPFDLLDELASAVGRPY